MNKNGAVIGTVRTPASMRTAFNNSRTDRRIWTGRTWHSIDSAMRSLATMPEEWASARKAVALPQMWTEVAK